MWYDVLQYAGFPTKAIVLDFESYFDTDYTLSKMSIPAYVHDDRFEFTGLGYQRMVPAGVGPGIFVKPGRLPRFFKSLTHDYGENLENITVVIQNAFFDAYILKHLWNIHPRYIIDTKYLDAHQNARDSHRLKDIAKRLKLPEKGDTMNFKGLHWNNMTLEQRDALAEYTIRDAELEGEIFRQLLPKVSNPEVELPLMNHTSQLFLRDDVRIDKIQARQLKLKMYTEMFNAGKDVGYTQKELCGTISFTKALLDALPENEELPMKPGKPGKNLIVLTGRKGMIPAISKTDDGCEYLLNHPDKKVRTLMESRLAVKSWPNHISRINTFLSMSSHTGCLPIALNYYGAHTGRWSGAEKTNVQNLGSRSHPLINGIRRLLTAPDGHTFVIVDAAQIEARVLAWIAGQKDLVDDFRAGVDLYSKFSGQQIFKSPVRKPKDCDPPQIKEMLKVRRQFGKTTILGCGYGMGKNRFFEYMGSDNVLSKYVKAGKYDLTFAGRVVDLYRNTFDAIPAFWKKVESAFKMTLKYNQVSIVTNYDGAAISFFKEGSTVLMELPNGRTMRYPFAKLGKGEMGSEIRWKYGYLWGGSITENIVQAIARDILAECILTCERLFCIPIIFHAHDEVIACEPQEHAQEALENVLRIMSTPPSWGPDLPLDAEGMISERYCK